MNTPAFPFSLANWLTAARASAQQPPRRPRWPLWVAGQPVGSVEANFLGQIGLKGLLDKRYQLLKKEHSGTAEWHLQAPLDEVTLALNSLAEALRVLGCCGPWRNEQLAVCNATGQRIGTIERGAVRMLGLATQAVHLVGKVPDGRIWVQQRAFNKPNNPGQWDTLMGGMVSAADSLPEALAREAWEEAGLHLSALADVVHGGHLDFAMPSEEGDGSGYMRERIDWFCCTVPDGLEPQNQDGEVEKFALLAPEAVGEAVAQGQFTLEAGLVLANFWRL